jgi:hypothetical protein
MIPAESQITGILFFLREEGQLDKQGRASRQAGKEKQMGKEDQLDKHVCRERCFLSYTAENSHHLTNKIISKEALF